MIPLKNVLVDNGLPVLVKNRQRQIRQRSLPYGADIEARDTGNTFFGENTLLMIAGDRFSWTHPNPDLSLVTDWREVGRMNFLHGDIPSFQSDRIYLHGRQRQNGAQILQKFIRDLHPGRTAFPVYTDQKEARLPTV